MGNSSCLERTEMKRYLHGWTDEATAIEFEKHLSVCLKCEQTLSLVDAETQNAGLPGLLSPSAEQDDAELSDDESLSSDIAAEFPTELPDFGRTRRWSTCRSGHRFTADIESTRVRRQDTGRMAERAGIRNK